MQVLYWDGEKQLVASIYGDAAGKSSIPCRVHSACISAHVFSSIECDCREQLELSMQYIQQEGAGVVIWLDQEARGNGMAAHIASQKLKRDGMSQSDAYQKLGYPADARRYETAAEVLRDLKVESIVVLTNNPKKVDALRAAGLPVVKGSERVYIVPDNALLRKQYQDKIRDGHWIKYKED